MHLVTPIIVFRWGKHKEVSKPKVRGVQESRIGHQNTQWRNPSSEKKASYCLRIYICVGFVAVRCKSAWTRHIQIVSLRLRNRTLCIKISCIYHQFHQFITEFRVTPCSISHELWHWLFSCSYALFTLKIICFTWTIMLPSCLWKRIHAY